MAGILMRENIKAFAGIISNTLPVTEPVYEFGSLQVPEQIGFANLRPLFQGKEYTGCDMREGPGVDRVLDLHEINLPSGSVGMVLCFDTLEHVEYPLKALQEIHRILKPDGIAVISSVMNFPIHDYPHDYWRFTPEAFRSILKPFSDCFIGSQGHDRFPHTVVGIGFKGSVPALTEFTGMYEDWKKHDMKTVRQVVSMITPPVLLSVAAHLQKTALRLINHSA
jgi:SAM-dependent methyltransferase